MGRDFNPIFVNWDRPVRSHWMFKPQGFLVKSLYALTCEYPPGTVGLHQVKSRSKVFRVRVDQVNSHFVCCNRPPGQ